MAFLDMTPVCHFHVLRPLHVSMCSILFHTTVKPGQMMLAEGTAQSGVQSQGSFTLLDHYARPESEQSLPRNTRATEERGLESYKQAKENPQPIIHLSMHFQNITLCASTVGLRPTNHLSVHE